MTVSTICSDPTASKGDATEGETHSLRMRPSESRGHVTAPASRPVEKDSRHSQVSEVFVATPVCVRMSCDNEEREADPEKCTTEAPLLEAADFHLEPEPEVDEIGPEVEESDGVPYDRGWAWMLVLGLFVNFMLLSGYLKSSGIIFVELMHRFNAPTTHTSLLFTVRAGFFSVCGLYTMNVFLGQFGCRKLILAGGLLMALSAILSSLANDLTLLIFIHSILIAMGMAMVISPGEVLLGSYFRKRRALALSLAKCGASIGSIAVPPLFSYLLETYGLSGTLLLYGGICLFSLPSGMLFRPLSFYRNRHDKRRRLRAMAQAEEEAEACRGGMAIDGNDDDHGVGDKETCEELNVNTTAVGDWKEGEGTENLAWVAERTNEDAEKVSGINHPESLPDGAMPVVDRPGAHCIERTVNGSYDTSVGWGKNTCESRVIPTCPDKAQRHPQDFYKQQNHTTGQCHQDNDRDIVSRHNLPDRGSTSAESDGSALREEAALLGSVRRTKSDIQNGTLPSATLLPGTNSATNTHSDSRLQRMRPQIRHALPTSGPRTELMSSKHFDTLEGDLAALVHSTWDLAPITSARPQYRQRTYSLPPEKNAASRTQNYQPEAPRPRQPPLASRQHSEDSGKRTFSGFAVQSLSSPASIIQFLSVSEVDLDATSMITILQSETGGSVRGKSCVQGSARSVLTGVEEDYRYHRQPAALTICEVEEVKGYGEEEDEDRQTHCVGTGRLCRQALRCLLFCPRKMVFMLDFRLFRSPLFRLLLLYFSTSPFVNVSLDYLPALAAEHGVNEQQAALLVSVVGGLDLLCRLCCGFFADLHIVSVQTMIIITFTILAVVVQFVSFLTSFTHLLGLAVLQGLFGGVANCLAPVLIIDFVGLENMGKAIGFCQLVSGASMAIIYPILGFVKDSTGQYSSMYHVIGCGMLLSAGILCLEGAVKRWEKNNLSTSSRPEEQQSVAQV